MKTNRSNVEIAELEQNKINVKIKRVEGYVVKKSSLSFYLKWYYDRRSRSAKCKKSGLNYEYFIHKPDNACFVFTECPSYYCDNGLEIELEDCIIITIYESQPDFMTSNLAAYYREYYIENAVSSWDEFGCFTTDSKSYNNFPIVRAISRLRPNKEIRYELPKKGKCLFDNFL
jgi:hypothetical protein